MIRPATAVDAPGIGDIRNTAIRDTTITFISDHARTAGKPALIGVVAGKIPPVWRFTRPLGLCRAALCLQSGVNSAAGWMQCSYKNSSDTLAQTS